MIFLLVLMYRTLLHTNDQQYIMTSTFKITHLLSRYGTQLIQGMKLYHQRQRIPLRDAQGTVDLAAQMYSGYPYNYEQEFRGTRLLNYPPFTHASEMSKSNTNTITYRHTTKTTQTTSRRFSDVVRIIGKSITNT